MRLARVAAMVCVCSTALPGQNYEMEAQQWADHYATVYQVPAELVHAIIEVESGWRPDAVSPKGAVGLMQLMPATAAAFGVRNRYDIEQNIRGGVAYLAHLMRQFRGELRLVVAAYFAGESRIAARGLRYSNPDVYRYVRRVGSIYRTCQLRLRVQTQRESKGGRKEQ